MTYDVYEKPNLTGIYWSTDAVNPVEAAKAYVRVFKSEPGTILYSVLRGRSVPWAHMVTKPLPKPGELYDDKGYPIYPGDLLRSYHFTDRRRKKHYLYHGVIWNTEEECMEAVPVRELALGKGDGGRVWLHAHPTGWEIVAGSGQGKGQLDYTDRPKKPKEMV